jgi:hypothetical protein
MQKLYTILKKITSKKTLTILQFIPKTGTTSLTSTLKNQYTKNQILEIDLFAWWYNNNDLNKTPLSDESNMDIINEDIVRLKRFSKRFESKLVYGHFLFGIHKHIKRKCQYITFLRNPEHACISAYNNMLKYKSQLTNCDKEEYENIELYMKQISNYQTFFLSGETDFEQLHKQPEELLKKAKYNIDKWFVFIGTLENYNKSVSSLGKILEWNNEIKIYHHNSGKYNKNIITAEVYKKISEYNWLDKELYEYVQSKFS